MKVILLQDVAKIGRKLDVADVSDGYALNKLIPQKLAQEATPQNLKRIESHAQKVQQEKAQHDTQFAQALEKLEGTVVTIAVEANDDGKLFQTIKANAIAQAIQEQTGAIINVEEIVITDPIKSTGEHTVALMLADTKGTCTIEVTKK